MSLSTISWADIIEHTDGPLNLKERRAKPRKDNSSDVASDSELKSGFNCNCLIHQRGPKANLAKRVKQPLANALQTNTIDL